LANTPARLREIISSSTYGILINEATALAEPQYIYIVELFKSVIENTQARGGFFNNSNKRVLSLILALDNLILTGNAQPPADTGFARRYPSIPFSSSDQLDPANPEHAKRMDEFTIVFNKNRHKLKYLGTLQ
jgi:hypothetical protein